MKLSEAIRNGAVLGPQAHGTLKKTRERSMLDRVLRRNVVVEYCALGGAYEVATGGAYKRVKATSDRPAFRGGVTKAGEFTQEMETPSEWPMHTWARCAECQAVAMPLAQLIPHLNDTHEWSREKIADFVAAVEDMPPAIAFRGNSAAEIVTFPHGQLS